VLQEHRIEGRVFEREVQGVADLKGHAIGQAAACRQPGSRIDERRAQVEPVTLQPKVAAR
jgi:hypothetical protein